LLYETECQLPGALEYGEIVSQVIAKKAAEVDEL